MEFGIGTQQIAEILENEFKIKCQIIESDNANFTNKIEKILSSDAQIFI